MRSSSGMCQSGGSCGCGIPGRRVPPSAPAERCRRWARARRRGLPGWAQPCRSPPPADIISQPLDSRSLLRGQRRAVPGEPGRGPRLLGGSRRWPRAGGPRALQRGGRERRLRAGGCHKFVRVRARDPLPAAGRSRRSVPPAARAALGPAPRSKGHRVPAGRAEPKLSQVPAVSRSRWETMALGLGARGSRKGRIPQPAAWQPSGLTRGPEERGRDPAIAADAHCTVISLPDTCLVLGFAFYNQLTRCT